MDRRKRPSKLLASSNSQIYMDLKDIIREHALRFLPAKSLFRCQGVCRDWKLQVATPFFAHNQSISFHGISGLFCQTPGHPPSFISIDPKSCGVPDPSLKFLPVPVNIRASSNGLLCCQDCTGDKTYYICNPVTRQWKNLPKPTADHGLEPAIVLIFEPSLLNFVAEYKLICAFPSLDFDDATEFEVYSSKEGYWRVSGEICFANKKLIPRSGAHVNGIVYWQSQNGGMIAYDLTKDRSQLIQGYFGVNSCLGMVDGTLCMAYPNCTSITLNVLSNVHSNTMQMGSKSRMWKVRHDIHLDQGVLGGAGYDRGSVFFVDDNMVLGHNGGVIYSYDMKTKETKPLCRSLENDARAVSYVNTIVYI